MPFTATVLKVFIASPGDIKNEREIIREVVYEWNAIHSESQGIVLMPVGWETHSSPAMDGRAQGIINEQVLSGCDLLVATFWTRIGTATGGSASGTVEEIDEHLAAGKPAMIYFSAVPVVLDSVDSFQYAALRDFKNRTFEDGLVESYESTTEFERKFKRQLAQTVLRKFKDLLQSGSNSPEKARGTKSIQMGEAAQKLLIEASQDSGGEVSRFQDMEGTNVFTNNQQMGPENDPRSVAKWNGAIRELCDGGYLRSRGNKDVFFDVTDKGFELADRLRTRPEADVSLGEQAL